MDKEERKRQIYSFMAHHCAGTMLPSSRTLSFGGAASCLALVYLITQLPTKSPTLDWSLALASLALPLWLSLALSYEIWIALKLDIDDLFSVKPLARIQATVFYCLGIITFLAVGLLIYSVNPNSGWLFVLSSVIGFLITTGSLVIGAILLARRFRQTHPDY